MIDLVLRQLNIYFHVHIWLVLKVGCTDVAIKKARTAALFAAESGMLGKMSQPGLVSCHAKGDNERIFFISFGQNHGDTKLVHWQWDNFEHQIPLLGSPLYGVELSNGGLITFPGGCPIKVFIMLPGFHLCYFPESYFRHYYQDNQGEFVGSVGVSRGYYLFSHDGGCWANSYCTKSWFEKLSSFEKFRCQEVLLSRTSKWPRLQLLLSQDSLRLAITNSSQILGQKSILRKIVSDSQSKNPIEIFELSLFL